MGLTWKAISRITGEACRVIKEFFNVNIENMNTSVIFNRNLIAPCGMNCGTCIAYLRPKNKCVGCRTETDNKPKTRVMCIVKNCINLEQTSSGFCYDCETFPCKRINQLDRRYRTKYKTSFIENLLFIKEKGIDKFLEYESKRRTCTECGSILSVHRDKCLVCNYDLK